MQGVLVHLYPGNTRAEASCCQHQGGPQRWELPWACTPSWGSIMWQHTRDGYMYRPWALTSMEGITLPEYPGLWLIEISLWFTVDTVNKKRQFSKGVFLYLAQRENEISRHSQERKLYPRVHQKQCDQQVKEVILLCSSTLLLWVLIWSTAPVLMFSAKEDLDVLEWFQKRSTKMITGLEKASVISHGSISLHKRVDLSATSCKGMQRKPFCYSMV